jgi:hypothetical protein
VVLWILAVGSVVVGLAGIPEVAFHTERFDLFGEWLRPVLEPMEAGESTGGFWTGAGIAFGTSVLGISLAWLLYGHGVSKTVRNFVAAVPRLYKVVFHKYYIDEVYDFLVVRPVRFVSYLLWKAVDAFFIDLILVNGVGFIVSGFGKLSKYLQNGDLQRYVVALILGAAALVAVATRWDAHRAAQFELSVHGREVAVDARGAGSTAHRIEYHVDWDGHGCGSLSSSGCSWTPNQRAGAFRHTYDTPGKHTVVVEAIDPRWGSTSRETKTVTVQ